MKKLIFSNFFLILLIGFSNANAESCISIKKKIINEKNIDKNVIHALKQGVDSGDLCMQNLMGMMLYNGIFFERDISRAEQIFLDLSDKSYPEAQFNFALAMSKKLDQDPLKVTELIVGIYYKYSADRINNNLASLARDLGYKYTNGLLDMYDICSKEFEKNASCAKHFSKMSLDDINTIISSYELTIKEAQYNIANNRLKLNIESKKTADTIFTLLSLGALVHNVGQLSSGIGNNSALFPSEPNPWFNYGQGFGNPLGLYQFQLH